MAPPPAIGGGISVCVGVLKAPGREPDQGEKFLFPNPCCAKSIRSYDADDDLRFFEVIGGRDAVDEELLLKCKGCGDEWSRKYQKGSTVFWTKTNQVFESS